MFKIESNSSSENHFRFLSSSNRRVRSSKSTSELTEVFDPTGARLFEGTFGSSGRSMCGAPLTFPGGGGPGGRLNPTAGGGLNPTGGGGGLNPTAGGRVIPGKGTPPVGMGMPPAGGMYGAGYGAGGGGC